ncbi:MAG: hypothetical protein HY904_19960 [Deltaproteobacteria bacterium]|nr:hypothetical protein [Deltaproteobacteria bacterium]
MKPPLMDRQAVHDLATAAMEHLLDRGARGVQFRGDPEEIQEHHADFDAAVAALRFAAAQAVVLEDHSFLPAVLAAFAELSHWNDDAPGNADALSHAACRLAGATPTLTATLRAMAGHEDRRMREAAIAGLRPDDPAALAILDTLAQDPEARVRREARRVLATAGEVPWWRGKFLSDPVARIPKADAGRLRPVLERISTLLDELDHASEKGAGELAALIAQLPEELALEVGARALDRETFHSAALRPVAVWLLAQPRGVDAVRPLFQRWTSLERGFRAEHFFGTVAALMALTDRQRVALALFQKAAALPPAQQEDESTGAIMAAVAGRLWLPTADVTPLLDLCLANEDLNRHDNRVGSTLHRVLYASKADLSAWYPRLVQARLDGYPGAFQGVSSIVHAWLEDAPAAVLRPAAEQAVLKDDSTVAAWGVKHLLGRAHDPARDPPRAELAARFLAHPRTRLCVLEDPELCLLVTPVLRRQLREGSLDFTAARAAIRAIDDLWGGAAPMAITDLPDPSEAAKREAKHRRELRGLLGPRTLHGPVREDEWAQFRAARRDVVPRSFQQWRELVDTLPKGPWHPEDRALLQRLMETVRKEDRSLAMDAAVVLCFKFLPEDLPLMEELVSICEEDDRDWMQGELRLFREGAGIPHPRRKRRGAATPPQGAEWMDEADDER